MAPLFASGPSAPSSALSEAALMHLVCGGSARRRLARRGGGCVPFASSSAGAGSRRPRLLGGCLLARLLFGLCLICPWLVLDSSDGRPPVLQLGLAAFQSVPTSTTKCYDVQVPDDDVIVVKYNARNLPKASRCYFSISRWEARHPEQRRQISTKLNDDKIQGTFAFTPSAAGDYQMCMMCEVKTANGETIIPRKAPLWQIHIAVEGQASLWDAETSSDGKASGGTAPLSSAYDASVAAADAASKAHAAEVLKHLERLLGAVAALKHRNIWERSQESKFIGVSMRVGSHVVFVTLLKVLLFIIVAAIVCTVVKRYCDGQMDPDTMLYNQMRASKSSSFFSMFTRPAGSTKRTEKWAL
eukprot:GHVT01018844.1.p2 GENE.GHVT01018844.1~~GHVT01018844.1.p2  ORF type:complete len:357 (-),score=74.75 GHVT01018844.1:7081-8151(-)